MKHERQQRRYARDDWTLSEQLFTPVIDEQTWYATQKKLEAQDKNKRHRAPTNPALWLSRLLYCGHCGKPMRAFPRPSGKGEYCCSTYSKSVERGTATCCQRNSITHEKLEAFVLKFLDDAGHSLSEAKNRFALAGPPAQYQRMLSEAAAWDAKLSERLKENGLQSLVYDDYATDEQRLEAYSVIFGRELPTLAKRHEELNAEHDKLAERILNLPKGAKLAIAKASEKLEELERAMVEVKEKQTNAAEEYRRSLADFMTFSEEWASAQRSMTGETTAREKAEAVSKVIARIVLTFRATGRRHPATELDEVRIIPHGDDGGGQSGSDNGNGQPPCAMNVPLTISS